MLPVGELGSILNIAAAIIYIRLISPGEWALDAPVNSFHFLERIQIVFYFYPNVNVVGNSRFIFPIPTLAQRHPAER